MTNTTLPGVEQVQDICTRAIAAENERGGGEILKSDYLTVSDYGVDNDDARVVIVATFADNTATALRVARLWAVRIKNANEHNLPIKVKCRVIGAPPRYVNAYKK